MHTKIKHLFHQEIEKGADSDEYSENFEDVRPESPMKLQGEQPLTGHKHYGDYEVQASLRLEVDALRAILEADFKNQRIVDLENKVRDNKRVIVNLMTNNIFMLRFGFDHRKKE